MVTSGEIFNRDFPPGGANCIRAFSFRVARFLNAFKKFDYRVAQFLTAFFISAIG
jgi:hypothetical protein